jgi:hypothetical protein
MDPILNLLLPFLPLAMVTAAVVAFVRKLFTKADKPMIDGRLAVFALAAFVAFLVIVWAQLRAGGLDWTRLLIDWPVVFGLAVGGTTWLQKLRRDGLLLPAEIGAEIDVRDIPPVEDIHAKLAEMQATLEAFQKRSITVTGSVEVTSPNPNAGEEVVP